MRVLLPLTLLALAAAARADEPAPDRAKKLLVSEDYTVTWGDAVAFPERAELEVGDGSGHGHRSEWLRFIPAADRVTVLSVKYDRGFKPYTSKWPPELAPVSTARAELKPAAYAALLAELRVVAAVRVKAVVGQFYDSSTNNFWVNARVTAGGKAALDLDWAGYDGTLAASEYARPKAAVTLAREAIKGLDFKASPPTVEERAWASAKFARDWKTFGGSGSHWWVRERHIETIGVVGDAAALPALRDILAAALPKAMKRHASEARSVYQAINAVTRLTGRDVRDRPVEEMNLETNRRKVLDLLQDIK